MIVIVNKIVLILCYWPYLYLSLFYTFVLRATIKLGRLPRPEYPEPSDLGFDYHQKIIDETFEYGVYSVGIGIVFFILLKLAGKLTVNKIHTNHFLIGIIAMILDLFGSPFATWYIG